MSSALRARGATLPWWATASTIRRRSVSADVGLAMGGGSDIAKEVADIILTDTELDAIVRLRRMSQGLIDRLTSSYSKVMLTNSALLALGITGMITPQASSLLHNGSTIAYSLGNAKAYLRQRTCTPTLSGLRPDGIGVVWAQAFCI